MSEGKIVAVLCGVALLGMAVQASGQTQVSDTFTVFDPGGGVYMMATLNEGPEPTTYFVAGSGSWVDYSMMNHVIVIQEEGTPGNLISDYYGVADGGGGPQMLLWSEGEVPLTQLPSMYTPIAYFNEQFDGDPTPFPATMFLSQSLRDAGYTATFQSPEPASLMLLALGGLAMLRRKRA